MEGVYGGWTGPPFDTREVFWPQSRLAEGAISQGCSSETWMFAVAVAVSGKFG